jgi:tRNA pseudouridine55 synthase
MLDQLIPEFVGTVDQLPPMYSALKKDGKPLYQLARQGIEVERKPRSVQIDSLVIDDFSLPHVTFTVRCSKGTYVRTLCHDLGQRLSCGAHMVALRRLSCGQFNSEACCTLEELQSLSEQGQRLPMLSPAEALADWATCHISGRPLERLQDGVAPNLADMDVTGLSAGDQVRFLADNKLVAVAHFTPGGYGKRPGDFEILKVFPLTEDE